MDSLPSEVITRIFTYLPVYERRSSGVVNSIFYYASLDPTLLNDETFAFRTKAMGLVAGRHSYYPQHNIDNFVDVISNTKRKIFSFRIDDLDNNLSLITVLKKLKDQIVSLHFNDFTMTDLVYDFITSCDNLKTLKLEEMKMSASPPETFKPLLKLKSLIVIDRDRYTESNQILFYAPNLTDLKLIGRHYSFTSQLLFINYLNNGKNINSIEMTSYKAFLCLPEHIELKALGISCMYDFAHHEYETFISMLSKQILLEKLILLDFPCCLLVAISKLHNLKHLELYVEQDCCINNMSCLRLFCNSIGNMKHIKTFIIDSSFSGIFELEPFAIRGNILKSLTTLDCSIINCTKIVRFCKNLTNLTIRYNEIVQYSYSDLKLIIETLTNLTHLSLIMCLDEDLLLRLPISNIKGLISLKILGCGLTYRSLPCIQFPCLEELGISCFSLTDDQQWEEVKDIWKELGRSNPALINLHITFACPVELYESLYVPMENFINIEQLRLCFPRINCFGFFTYSGIRGRRYNLYVDN